MISFNPPRPVGQKSPCLRLLFAHAVDQRLNGYWDKFTPVDLTFTSPVEINSITRNISTWNSYDEPFHVVPNNHGPSKTNGCQLIGSLSHYLQFFFSLQVVVRDIWTINIIIWGNSAYFDKFGFGLTKLSVSYLDNFPPNTGRQLYSLDFVWTARSWENVGDFKYKFGSSPFPVGSPHFQAALPFKYGMAPCSTGGSLSPHKASVDHL